MHNCHCPRCNGLCTTETFLPKNQLGQSLEYCPYCCIKAPKPTPSETQMAEQYNQLLARIARLEWVAEAQGFCIKPSDV